MDNAAGVLLYKISNYIGLESIAIMEIFSTTIRQKLKGNLSAFQRLLIRQNITSDRLSFSKSKKVIGPRLFGVKPGSNSLCIYSIRQKHCTGLSIENLPVPFAQFGLNWVLMNSHTLLVGCGDGHTTVDHTGKGTGPMTVHSFYTIISLNEARVIQTGQMNEARSGYGLVKIGNMYYAILGKIHSRYNSSSLDIYDSSSGEWQLIPGLNYRIGYTCALEFQNMIYATGSHHVQIVQFDPSSLQHSKVQGVRTEGHGTPLMVNLENQLIIKLEPSCGSSLLITFDGNRWEKEYVKDETQLILSQYRRGDYLKHGECLYFINVNSQLIRINVSLFSRLELVDVVKLN